MNTIVLPMTTDQLEGARTRLAQQGIVLTGDSGEVTGHGVTVDFAYDGNDLKLTVTKKPFLLPESALENAIRGWFEPA